MIITLTDDFWGLHKNMNCAFPLTFPLSTITNPFKKHFANLASDLLKKYHILTLQENLEHPQCSSITKQINFRENKT